ncbi:MAG: class I tRNA ligase family protein, partial [Synergistales bacterium]|nr:class I tRNA ligase family protein [Synergistales bacterium]
RVWGVPIPAFYCNNCGKLVMSPELIRLVQTKIRKHGSSIWWAESPAALLGEHNICPHCQSHDLVKDKDIMDVWFDSGVSHLAVLETRKELKWPADLYLEGSDQHRGWFQTSLLTSVATRDKAPYRAVLTHGFIVDGDGRKMSKSLGNVIKPQEIIDKYGADILRLWVASTDYRNDVRISQGIINNLIESYRRIRNTIRFLLGNLNDFHPSDDSIEYKELTEMDKWILSRLEKVIEKTTKAYDEYEFHVPTFVIHQFCVNELSSFFLDASKDRLYADGADSLNRRSCQSAMWEILLVLTKLLAPVLSFTTEEAWQVIRDLDTRLPESVFLSDWPSVREDWINEELEKTWSQIYLIKGAISRALEKARTAGLIGHPLEAIVKIEISSQFIEILKAYPESLWEMINIVSSFSMEKDLSSTEDNIFLDPDTGLRILINKAPGNKCPRCWRYSSKTDHEGLCPRCAEVLTSGKK